MKLHTRIRRLELRGNTDPASDSKDRLRNLLERIETRVLASGDLAHNPNGAVAENVARAFARGDSETARALLQGALARH